MINTHVQVINSLEKELERIKKDNERLSIQVETCEDMIHNYNLKIKDNDENIETINYVLSML